VQTISVTQADLEQMSAVLQKGEGQATLEGLGDVSVEGGSTEPSETTLAAAQAAVDFPVQTVAGAEGTPTVMLQNPMTVKFKLHIDKVNELLESYGATKTFSRSLDGKEFEIRMPATVALAYPDKTATQISGADSGSTSSEEGGITGPDPSSAIVLVQTRGPQLIVPPGTNPLEIRDVLLGLPFLPENIRSQLASVQDWQSTLLIPSIGGSSKEISVNGMPGVVIGVPQNLPAGPAVDPPMNPDEIPVAVMWNQDGVTRAIGGLGGESRIIKLAESVGR
jgi:hypothetical protein